MLRSTSRRAPPYLGVAESKPVPGRDHQLADDVFTTSGSGAKAHVHTTPKRSQSGAETSAQPGPTLMSEVMTAEPRSRLGSGDG